jgi:glycosyltransferase involved in cell wall biosynthesis
MIVPTYRDGARIYDNMIQLDHSLAAIGAPYEIIVVSDGNVDNTHDEVRRLNAPYVRVYHYARNMGKGFALRYGVTRSHGEIVSFIDGDGDIDPAQAASRPSGDLPATATAVECHLPGVAPSVVLPVGA